MKRYCLIGLLIVGMLHVGGRIASAETIRMGYFEISPHMYTSRTTGLPAGATVTFFETVARKMGYDVIWVGPIPHARLVYYLEEGEVIDGDPIMSKTPEREKFLCFPDTPFYLAKPNFVVKRDSPLTKINTIDDVKGYTLGQFSKAANSQFVTKNKSFFKFEIISGAGDTFKQHLKILFADRVDAIHTLDEFSMLYEAKKLNLDKQIKILFLPEPPLPFYSVFHKSENGKMLAEKYDIAIKELGLTTNHYLELVQHEIDLVKKETE